MLDDLKKVFCWAQLFIPFPDLDSLKISSVALRDAIEKETLLQRERAGKTLILRNEEKPVGFLDFLYFSQTCFEKEEDQDLLSLLFLFFLFQKASLACDKDFVIERCFSKLFQLFPEKAAALYAEHKEKLQYLPKIKALMRTEKALCPIQSTIENTEESKENLSTESKETLEEHLKLLTTQLSEEKMPLGIAALFSSYHEHPAKFASALLWLLKKGLKPEQILKSQLLGRFLAVHLFELGAADNPVKQMYQLLSERAEASELLNLARQTFCKQRGFTKYNLCGECIVQKPEEEKNALKEEFGIAFQFTATEENFKKLYELFKADFLWEAFHIFKKENQHLKTLLIKFLNPSSHAALSLEDLQALFKKILDKKNNIYIENLALLLTKQTLDSLLHLKEDDLFFELVSYRPELLPEIKLEFIQDYLIRRQAYLSPLELFSKLIQALMWFKTKKEQRDDREIYLYQQCIFHLCQHQHTIDSLLLTALDCLRKKYPEILLSMVNQVFQGLGLYGDCLAFYLSSLHIDSAYSLLQEAWKKQLMATKTLSVLVPAYRNVAIPKEKDLPHYTLNILLDNQLSFSLDALVRSMVEFSQTPTRDKEQLLIKFLLTIPNPAFKRRVIELLPEDYLTEKYQGQTLVEWIVAEENKDLLTWFVTYLDEKEGKYEGLSLLATTLMLMKDLMVAATTTKTAIATAPVSRLSRDFLYQFLLEKVLEDKENNLPCLMRALDAYLYTYKTLRDEKIKHFTKELADLSAAFLKKMEPLGFKKLMACWEELQYVASIFNKIEPFSFDFPSSKAAFFFKLIQSYQGRHKKLYPFQVLRNFFSVMQAVEADPAWQESYLLELLAGFPQSEWQEFCVSLLGNLDDLRIEKKEALLLTALAYGNEVLLKTLLRKWKDLPKSLLAHLLKAALKEEKAIALQEMLEYEARSKEELLPLYSPLNKDARQTRRKVLEYLCLDKDHPLSLDDFFLVFAQLLNSQQGELDLFLPFFAFRWALLEKLIKREGLEYPDSGTLRWIFQQAFDYRQWNLMYAVEALVGRLDTKKKSEIMSFVWNEREEIYVNAAYCALAAGQLELLSLMMRNQRQFPQALLERIVETACEKKCYAILQASLRGETYAVQLALVEKIFKLGLREKHFGLLKIVLLRSDFKLDTASANTLFPLLAAHKTKTEEEQTEADELFECLLKKDSSSLLEETVLIKVLKQMSTAAAWPSLEKMLNKLAPSKLPQEQVHALINMALDKALWPLILMLLDFTKENKPAQKIVNVILKKAVAAQQKELVYKISTLKGDNQLDKLEIAAAIEKIRPKILESTLKPIQAEDDMLRENKTPFSAPVEEEKEILELKKENSSPLSNLHLSHSSQVEISKYFLFSKPAPLLNTELEQEIQKPLFLNYRGRDLERAHCISYDPLEKSIEVFIYLKNNIDIPGKDFSCFQGKIHTALSHGFIAPRKNTGIKKLGILDKQREDLILVELKILGGQQSGTFTAGNYRVLGIYHPKEKYVIFLKTTSHETMQKDIQQLRKNLICTEPHLKTLSTTSIAARVQSSLQGV